MNSAAGASPLPAPRGDDRRLRKFGYTVIAVVFGGFGGWAALAPLDSAAVAPGVIVVQHSRKTIQHLEGGIVRELLVQEGQWVEKDAPLLELEGKHFRAELESANVQRATLRAMEARLTAERDGARQPRFPEDLAGAADERVREAVASQQALFDARRKAHEGEISVLRQTVSQLRAQIAGNASLVASKRQLIQSFEAEISDLRKLLQQGFVDRQKLRDFERNVAGLQGEVAELESASAATGARVGETELRILQVQRDFQAGVAAELGETQAKLSDATERSNAAGDRVTRMVIRAPVSGRVLKLAVHTVGGVVAPGAPIMDIVPENEDLVVEGRVSPLDIERVRAGLAATVQLTGLRRDRQKRLHGEVVTVSADRLVDERTGESYFSAQMTIGAEERRRLGNAELQPGMPAEVMINTGSRTLLGYLWDPIRGLANRSFRED